MKIFTTEQIRAWDAYTIKYEPITSLALMNRAATAFADWFAGVYRDTERPVFVFAGTGNNGGDGVAVARLLHQRFFSVKVFVCDFNNKHSPDFDAQINELPRGAAVAVHRLNSAAGAPRLPDNALVIDALFGSGLSRALDGEWATIIDVLNRANREIIAIDLPSGLFADAYSDGPCIQAARTFSFEIPKYAFFFPENAGRVGEWAFGGIGLHPAFAAATETPFNYLTRQEAQALVRRRPVFSHKGTYGHALLCNGSQGKMGAAVLAARACLRSGVGLLSLQTPGCGYSILQSTVPEAMCRVDRHEQVWSELPDTARFTAVGAGCGIGLEKETAAVLERLLLNAQIPLVLDADALNLLAGHSEWWRFLPKNTLLTPHPKEFERLFGATENSIARNALQRRKAQQLGVYIILKGAYTAIACPDGSCWFNSTGNPGMATGGTGDALTGILTGLLAQGYPPHDAALLGVYLHGLAGDLAARSRSQAGMTAGDVIDHLGAAWLELDARA